MYPNPATDRINVELGANQLHVQRIDVLDVLGRVLAQVSVDKQTRLSIPSGQLTPGVYVLRFRGDTTPTQCVVVQ